MNINKLKHRRSNLKYQKSNAFKEAFNSWQVIYPILFIFAFLFPSLVNAAENSPTSASNKTQQIPTDNASDMQPTIAWPINLKKLSESSHANEKIWLDIKGEKALVLKYSAKTKFKRGDILLIPAEGENAEHPRLINGLTQQLNQLGWSIYIPTLPFEDYPQISQNLSATDISVTNTSSTASSNNQTTENPISAKKENSSTVNNLEKFGKPFFTNADDYQAFIDLFIKILIAKIQPTSEQLMIIANQHSAYWILNSTKQLTEITQVVLLKPLVPSNVSHSVDKSFEGQFLPIYTFMESNQSSRVFAEALQQGLWQSNFQRIDNQLIDGFYLEIEDLRLAKRITGWSESLKK